MPERPVACWTDNRQSTARGQSRVPFPGTQFDFKQDYMTTLTSGQKLTTPTLTPSRRGTPSRRPGATRVVGTQASPVKEMPQVPLAASREKVSFDWVFPNARQVFIVGSFNNWQPLATPLRNCGGNRWLLEIALEPGRYEYRFVVDGKFVDEPGLPGRAAESSGGHKSVLVISA